MTDAIKVLVVEDDEVDRMAIRRALNRGSNAVEIIEVEDCQSAIAALEQHRDLECVFLDYRLPDNDGLQLVQQIRALKLLVPLVVLTGQGDEQIAVDLMKAGASDYLSKEKVSPENLTQSLHRAIRVYRAEKEAARATARLRESEERYRLVLEGSNEGIWDWNLQSRVLYYNDRLREILGLATSNLPLTPSQFCQLVHGQDRDRLKLALKTHLEQQTEQIEVEFRLFQYCSGEERYCILRGKAQRATGGKPQRLSGVMIDITERRRAEERSLFLAEASKLLSTSLNYQSTLENLARLAVPRLADWCAIDLVDPEQTYNSPETLKRIAVAHVDPKKSALVWALQRYLDPGGCCCVLRTGRPDACFEVSPQRLQEMAEDEHHLALLQQLNLRSYLCVPLQVKEQVLGTLLFAWSESARRYSKADLLLAEDLARRAGLAIENARLYQQAQEASNSLRKALWILGEQQQQLRTLQRLTNLLNQRLSNLPELLRVMAESTCNAVAGAQVCFIALYDPEVEQILLTVMAGQGADDLKLEAAFSPQEGVLHSVFETGKPQLIQNPDRQGDLPAAIYAVPIASMQSGRLGILAVGNWDNDSTFDEEDQRLLTAVGEQAAIAIENARLIKALEEREERLERQNQILAEQNTALEEQRRQIQLQNLKLLEAARLKSQFLATMSHELRTPMNAIIGFSQLLLRQGGETLKPSHQQMLERILSNGKTLLALINDILDLSKMEAGHLEIRPQKLNLQDLVAATLAELQSLAEEKHLNLALHSQLENPEVFNDSTRLRQILINLLSNAIKFTETGGVTVTICELTPDCLELTVQDTGIGMSQEQQAQIFEEFRQVDQTTTRKYSGTGLGLAITKSLIQLMQGQIAVESELGKGSTFRIQLPRQVQAYAPGNDDLSSPNINRFLLDQFKTTRQKRQLY